MNLGLLVPISFSICVLVNFYYTTDSMARWRLVSTVCYALCIGAYLQTHVVALIRG